MDFGDVLKTVKTVAPWIATAMGTPLAGLAIEAAASAMGLSESTADAVRDAVATASPEQMRALQQADRAFALEMRSLDYKSLADLEGIAAGDRASARKAAVEGGTSRQLFWLSLVLLTACLGSEITVLFIGLPATANDLVAGRVLGMLDAIALTVLTYNYGSTNNSSKRSDALVQVATKR